jgi:serine/threonine-protein kinase
LTPFVADNAYALIHKIAREDAPPLRNFAPDADPQLAAIVDRALRRDLEARFDDARQFLAAMQAWSPTAMQPLRVPAGSMPPPRPAMRAQAPTVVPAQKDDSARRATRIVALAAGGVAIFAAGALASTWLVAGDTPANTPTAVESDPRVDAAIAPAAAEVDMAAAAEVVAAAAREAATHAAAHSAAAQLAADEAEKAESKKKGSAAAPGRPANRTPQRVAPKVGDVTF